MADSIIGTQIIHDLGGRPHFGVRLIIDTKAKDARVWSLKKPAQIPGLLPAGCKQHIPIYTCATELGANPTEAEVCVATKQWYDVAESEFVDIMGLNATEAVAYQGRAEGASFVLKFSKHNKRI